MQAQTNAAAPVTDDVVIARVFDLSRQGETASREYELLDYVIQKRLLQTYGGEVGRGTAYAA